MACSVANRVATASALVVIDEQARGNVHRIQEKRSSHLGNRSRYSGHNLMKQFLERHSTIVGWIFGVVISVLIPAAIAVSTYFVTRSIEGAKLDSEYIRIALGILSKERTKESNDNPTGYAEEDLALRQWAVRLLNEKSPEKFSVAEQHALLKVGIFYLPNGAKIIRNPDGSEDYWSTPYYNDNVTWSSTLVTKPKSPEPKKEGGAPTQKKP